MTAARCRSCGAEILWCQTKNDKSMPVDFNPPGGMRGNVRVVFDSAGAPCAEVLTKEALELARSAGEQLGVSHHATCAHGRAWRRS